jgi:ABC-2 type transport system ATP-binding protein
LENRMNNELELIGVSKSFIEKTALKKINAKFLGNQVTGIVGPDGAGKTTLIRMLAGLLKPSEGKILFNGFDISNKDSNFSDDISYMPQKFGLYEDLTVMENLNLYADLKNIEKSKRKDIFDRLLKFTSLEPFTNRFAGRLSGGMKQKLGLACCLIKRPKLLLLDEPSVGVDPLSRQDLWKMVYELLDDGIVVIWSTAYLDEAERCKTVLVLNEGNSLYYGEPQKLTDKMKNRVFLASVKKENKRRFSTEILKKEYVLDSVIQGEKVRVVLNKSDNQLNADFKITKPRFEDSFISLLGGIPKKLLENIDMDVITKKNSSEKAVVVTNLTKKFGDFVAVNNSNFSVSQGEVLGLLGPNGAGKSTTFKMMCGLLKPTTGQAIIHGINLIKEPNKARNLMGYMAQKFSLYGDLSVMQNLRFFGGVYGLKNHELQESIHEMIEKFELNDFLDMNASELPLGYKQRLSMACAIMHKPLILFLDEPTSGVDPITRREFWININSLVEAGTSVIVTTHFIDEAEYCDRIALMYKGNIIAYDTPDNVRKSVKSEELQDPLLEDAFIELIKKHMENSNEE